MLLLLTADLNNWDTRSVTDMSNMFNNALAIDRIIADWNVSAVTNMAGMFDGASGLSDLKKGIKPRVIRPIQTGPTTHGVCGAGRFQFPKCGKSVV